MGTFHDTTDPLHGITVVVHMGKTVHVGRCHERDDKHLLLVDTDSHTVDETGCGHDGRTMEEFLQKAVKFGVWAKEPRLILPVTEISSMVPLNQYFVE